MWVTEIEPVHSLASFVLHLKYVKLYPVASVYKKFKYSCNL